MIELIFGIFGGTLLGWVITKMHFEKRLNKAFLLYCGKNKITAKDIQKEFAQFEKKTNVKYELKEY